MPEQDRAAAVVVGSDGQQSSMPPLRRAKLYYLRNLRGKAAKIKEKREVGR